MKNESLPAVTQNNGHLPDVTGDGVSAPEFEQEADRSGLNLYDVLYMLFRHKWTIACCAALGMVAAAAVFLLIPPVYESKAELFVRYVVDKSAIDGLESQIKTPDPQNDTLINDEVQILT